MSDRIKLLPEIVANQIAAGEVVEEPSSVVKEMMENSIDAGASCVKVYFRNGGLELIQIIDNGCGMSPVDARMAFDRHATSKISTLDDIYRLHTFGFRGEALASIAAISQVELRTRQCDEETGTETIIEGGVFRSQKPIMTEVGSQFLVRNLFYNVPARRKFTQEPSKHASRIKAEFQRVALCNPEVEFELYANDAPIYKLERASLANRIVDVIGKSIKNNLLEIDADTSIVRLRGYIGRPSVAKRRNNEQFLFVNGRFFKSQYLNKAILKAYEKLIPEGCFPSFFIFIDIDPDRVDVNVSPRKTEVKFADMENVWQILNAAVRETLAKTGAVPLLDFDNESDIEIPISQQGIIYSEPKSASISGYNPFREGYISEDDEPLHTATSGNRSAGRSLTHTPSGLASAPHHNKEFALDEDFDRGYILPSQMNDTMSDFDFIPSADFETESMETSEGMEQELEMQAQVHFESACCIGNYMATALYGGRLVVVDLRRAQEQLTYENYLQRLQNCSSVSQQLLFPQLLTLSNDDYSLLEENEIEFASLGFDIKFAGDGNIEVNGIPADSDSAEADMLIYELLRVFDTPESVVEVRRQNLAAAMARSVARRVSPKMSNSEASALLDRLAESGNVSFTPAGKAIMAEISIEELRNKLG
ncbi:MAG: DNA mismatch repair endonuclease MutL [Alistipes sp.]|nr:DNA mismatch repair endonuclease MutL [Alistipes sp.]